MTLAAEPQQDVLSLMPIILSYSTNVGVVELLWTVHHIIFKLVRRTKNALPLMNVLFLVCVTFVMLPITLIERYSAQPLRSCCSCRPWRSPGWTPEEVRSSSIGAGR